MLKMFCSIGFGIVLLIAPALLPVPTFGPSGFTMHIDEAKADCDATCMRKCSEATARGVYMTMDACIAVWSPRNAQKARERTSPKPPSSEAASCGEYFKKCTSIRTEIQGPYGSCEERLATCKQTGKWTNRFGEKRSTR